MVNVTWLVRPLQLKRLLYALPVDHTYKGAYTYKKK
jgi:hypothetical protein